MRLISVLGASEIEKGILGKGATGKQNTVVLAEFTTLEYRYIGEICKHFKYFKHSKV